jgi:MOSC domain-containing protein YiiM/ferredoxin-NADP reductase
MGRVSVPKLLAVNVGLPQDIPWLGQTVHTSIWKQPVQGRRAVRRLNIEGDGQGDLAGHGGEQRAVMVYQIDSYRYWERTLGRSDFTFGQFSENLTVEGLPDDEVSIGDRYRIGSALFEVTQPRVTCYRVGIRMNHPQIPAMLVSHHRPGFYLRVLEEGDVGSGDEIVKVAEGPEHVTVAEIDALLYLPGHPRDQLERALRIPALSPGWKGSLQALIVQVPGGGNRGLTTSAGPPPAWNGFRRLRVARIDRESAGVISLTFESEDRSPLPPALPGQFLVLKLQPAPDMPAILRNYSMSGAPDGGTYRVTVKQEVNGKGSAFIHGHVKAGDILEASAPRGTFTLGPGDGPVVLLSAGIGATPVLAMLHALAAARSPRDVWWLYGARNAADPPLHRLQPACVRGPPRHRVRCLRTPEPCRPPASRRTARGRLLFVRPLVVSAQLDCRPRELGCRERASASGDLRVQRIDDPGDRRHACPGAAPAAGSARSRTTGLLCPQRPRRAVESRLSEPSGTGRSLRSSSEMVVPDGSLPHVRVRLDRRVGQLPARAARASGGRQCSDLLLTAADGSRTRSLTGCRLFLFP